MHMNLKTLRTLLPFLICLVLFSCTKKTHEEAIADNAEIKAFVNYFFIPRSTLLKKRTEVLSLQDQAAQSLLSTVDICSSDSTGNRTKDYFLALTPNFLFETINGQKIVSGADPDAYVDVCDRREKKVYRVRQTGTEGSIYGTFWLSDVFDIKAKTKISYSIDKARRKPNVDLDAFLIAKYGHEIR
jgi:hypothetical protein